MKVEFKGTLSEVQKQAYEWKTAHPDAKIIWPGAPIRVGHQDGENIFDKDDWKLTIEYENGSSAK